MPDSTRLKACYPRHWACGDLELEVVLRDDETPAVGEAIAKKLLETLEIPPENLLRGAYIDMLERIRTTLAR